MSYLAFNSLAYIVFLLLVVAVYYVYPDKFRWIILLISSIVFYIFAGVEKLPFIIFTSIVVWYASFKINRLYTQADSEAAEKQLKGKDKMLFMASYKRKCRNRYLIPTLVVVVGILCYCKFAKMLAEGIAELLGNGPISLKVIVPLGISYYTFSTVGYLLDVYWRKQKYVKNYFKFALCVFYFPQIVQGPIARYNRLMIEIEKEHPFDYKRICFGIQLMLYGYFKKMVIADRLVLFTTEVFNNIEKYEGLTILIALIFSTFQLYMDFSGCMDIVRGTSQIFGIELDKNFDHPFFSKNVAEFWRRWHITLGTWFKDYVYLPVATSPWLIKLSTKIKNRFGVKAAKNISSIVPLLIVWILTGVWHGTGWNYVAWGIYYGVIIICATIFADKYKTLAERLHIDTTSKGYSCFQMVRTFCMFTIGRLISAPGTLKASGLLIKQLFSTFNPWIFWDGTLYRMGLDYKDFCVAILGLLLVWKISVWQEQRSVREKFASYNIVLRWAIYYAAFFAIIILGMYGTGYDASAFVYAQF